jgi:hypothetical protein
MKSKIFIVQGDPRDHHGEIILVTRDEQKAKEFCRKKIKIWNKVQGRIITESDKTAQGVEIQLRADAKNLSLDAFLEKYLGSAWICSPQLYEYYA